MSTYLKKEEDKRLLQWQSKLEKMCRSEPKNELTSFMQEEKSQVERKEETMEKTVRERQRKGHGKNK